MANSVVRSGGESFQDFSRQPSAEIIQESEAKMSQCFIKEEKREKSLCARMERHRQQSGKFQDKEEGSPLRSLSPEFLLRLSGDGAEHSRCEKNEMREEEIYRKDDDSSTNDVIIPVTCIYCNKILSSKNSLDVHVLAMHDGKKIYDCSVCDKQFSHRSSRNIHLRVHTGQRPYECEICKKRFRVSSHLRDHVRTHTGERPFKCALCGRGFKQSSDMKKHRKTHFKTSNTNGNWKTIHFNNNEFAQEYENKFAGIIKVDSSFMNTRPEHLPGNYDNDTTDERPSPNVEHSNGNVANETTNQIIKVEMKSACEGVVSPLSCDSGVKVESDHSASPENITREKKIRYNNEPPLHESAAMDVATSARMPARYYAYGKLSNGHNFQERPTPASVASFYQPVPGNNYQFQNTGEKNPDEDFQEKQMFAGAYPVSAQHVENGLRRSVTMELQNGEVSITEHENRKQEQSEQAAFSNVYPMEKSDVPVAVTQMNPGQGIEKDITQDQGRNSGGINTHNGILPMNVETAATHEGMDVGRPSEDAVDDAEVAGRVSKSGIVRKAVVVKLRTEKENGTFKRTEMSSAKKLCKTTKRGRVQGTMQCASCLERFASLENFTAHTCEKNDKSFKCGVCAKMFARSTLLRQHMVLHQGTKRFKFKCTYCGRAFRHRSHLRDHERIHTGERPFKCSFCPKAFKQSSDLRKHENLHTGATRYCCEKCGVDFKRCDALKKHALLHPNGEVSVLKCEKCQSLFATAGGHSSHVCHSKNRYRCQLCVQRFSSAAALRKHCHQEHGDQSNATSLKCEICKLELQSLDELEVHLGTHQLLKPHKCNLCDQQFALISQLEEHTKTHSKNLAAPKTHSPPLQPLRSTEFLVSSETEDIFKENGENPPEGNAVTKQSVPVPSPGESVRQKRSQKYDFIPSSYQALVHSAPVYSQVKDMVKNTIWRPSPNANDNGSYAVPRLIKPRPTSQQGRENLGNRNDLADQIVRPIPTSNEKATANPEKATATAVSKYTTDTHGHKADEHFSPAGRKAARAQAPKRTYDCLNCGKSFYQENTLANHVCFIQSETFYRCLVCETDFRYHEDLLEHMRTHWKQVVYLRCNVCGQRVQNEDKLKEHNLKHIEHDRKMRYMAEETGEDNDKTPRGPWSSTHADQSRALVGAGSVFVLTNASEMSTISSLSTPVITSVSSDSSFYSKAMNHGNGVPQHAPERHFPEHNSSEMKGKLAKPLTSPRSANETADNDNRSLAKVYSGNEDAIPRRPHDQFVPYFDTRKPVPGAYLNVFCQGSTMVVPAMHPLEASGRYPGGAAGMMYPITMTHQRRMSEQKSYEN